MKLDPENNKIIIGREDNPRELTPEQKNIRTEVFNARFTPGQKVAPGTSPQDIIKQLEDTNAVLNDVFDKMGQSAKIRDILPYIQEVLHGEQAAKFAGILSSDVIYNLELTTRTDKSGAIVESIKLKDDASRAAEVYRIAAEMLKKASQKQRAADARESLKAKQDQGKEQAAGSIQYNKGSTIKTTSTKLANEFFGITTPATELDGQLALKSIYDRNGREVAVLSYYSYNESELRANGITKKEFTDFDYFVAMVCNNLFLENNRQVSLTKIWHEMGNPKAPNQTQLQELRKSLIKGMTTIINISNRDILEAYNEDTETYTDIKMSVMPVIIKTEHNRTKGNVTNETVYILELSPFMLVAEPLNQITTWNKDILKLYKGSRTAKYWSVLRCLMREIAWMRNDKKRNPKITFDYLFSETGSNRTEARNAALKIAESLLEDTFKPCGYIKDFKIDHQKRCITLTCTPKADNTPKITEKSK